MRLHYFIGSLFLSIMSPAFSAQPPTISPTDRQVLSAVIAPLCHPKDASFKVLSRKPYVPDDSFQGLDPDVFAQMRHSSKFTQQLPVDLGCDGVHMESERLIQVAFQRKPSHPIESYKIPWGGFYETFPGTSGLMYVSMPGYSATGDSAMVYVHEGCGGFCGAGRLLTLRRIGGKWYVVSSRIEDIS